MKFVYKLTIKECDSYYIGITNNPKKRLSSHKEKCFSNKNGVYKLNNKLYTFIRDNVSFEEWNNKVEMEILQDNVLEEDSRNWEDYYIDLNDEYCLNTIQSVSYVGNFGLYLYGEGKNRRYQCKTCGREFYDKHYKRHSQSKFHMKFE